MGRFKSFSPGFPVKAKKQAQAFHFHSWVAHMFHELSLCSGVDALHWLTLNRVQVHIEKKPLALSVIVLLD